MSNDKKSTQGQKFIDKARELGADENEAAFGDKLKRLAQPKPMTMKNPGQVTGVFHEASIINAVVRLNSDQFSEPTVTFRI